MKLKKLLSVALALLLLASAGGFAFAADGEDTEDGEETAYVIVPNMNFTGTPIDLSLEQAIHIMQTEGLSAEAANIAKQADQAIITGYSQSARSISEAIRSMSGGGISASLALEAAGATSVNQRIVRIQHEFASEHIDHNYQADMNKIENTTISLYYGVLLAQDQLKATEDNLQNRKDILTNTQKKYDLGTAAKIDLTSAEIEVTKAANEVLIAQRDLTEAKMNFNNLLGYDLMQAVNFTDTLKEIDAPAVTLKKAIENALENRLEISGSVLAEEVQKIVLDHSALTISTSSATYKQQYIAYLQAVQQKDNAPKQIEMDVRTKYIDMNGKKSALDSARATLELAEESYRLAMISYDAGMNTLTDVQEAQLLAFNASQGVAMATMNYDLAVYAYNYAQGVGTERINLALS